MGTPNDVSGDRTIHGVPYVALDACLVDNLINLVGGDTWLDSRRCFIEHFPR